MKIYKIIDEPTNQQPQEESWPAFIGRHAVADVAAPLARGVAKIPGHAADLALSINQSLTPENKRLSSEQYEGLKLTPQIESAEKQFAKEYLPEKYLDAQHEVPRLIQKTVEKIPSFIGGGWQNTIARVAGSTAGKEFAKALGGNQFWQFAGSALGAGLASGALAPKDLKKLEGINYHSFTKSIPTNANQVLTNSSKAYNNAIKDQSLLPETSEWLSKGLKNVEPLFKRGKAPVSEIFDRMKYVNKLIRESAPSSEAKEVLSRISAGMKQDLIDAKKLYPNLDTQGLINGSSISYGLNNLSPLRKLLRKYVNTGTAAATAGGGIVGKQALAAIGIEPSTVGAAFVGGPLVRAGVETAESAYKSPAIRNHLLGDIAPRIAKGVALSGPSTKKQKKIYRIVD